MWNLAPIECVFCFNKIPSFVLWFVFTDAPLGAHMAGLAPLKWERNPLPPVRIRGPAKCAAKSVGSAQDMHTTAATSAYTSAAKKDLLRLSHRGDGGVTSDVTPCTRQRK